MSIDPYSSPAAPVFPSSPPSETALVQGVLKQLAGTKPWVRFISVLMFIGAGLLLIVAVVMLFVGGTIFQNANLGAYGAGMGIGMAVAYALFAFIYVYPALKLWKYASRIGGLLLSNSLLDLDDVLNEQRAFWKFIGVMMLLMLILYAVIAVFGIIAMVAGGMAAAKSQGA